MLFVGVYVCAFHPGNFTRWGSERVNVALLFLLVHGGCML